MSVCPRSFLLSALASVLDILILQVHENQKFSYHGGSQQTLAFGSGSTSRDELEQWISLPSGFFDQASDFWTGARGEASHQWGPSATCTRDDRNVAVAACVIDGAAYLVIGPPSATEALAHELERTSRESHYLFPCAERQHEAQVASLAKTDFLSRMSHELRTPLHAVLGMAQLMCENDFQDDVGDAVQIIKNSGEALLRVVEDVLDFVDLEGGDVTLDPSAFDVGNCLETVLEIAMPAARSKGIDLAFIVEEAVPASVNGDQRRIRQALSQLISNAIKFTSFGGVLLRTSCSRTTEGRLELQLAVSDSGIGISEEYHQQIFRSFDQVDGDWAREYGGVGLGLAISKRLCGLMGGNLSFESKPGIGSTFSISFVVDPVPEVTMPSPQEFGHGRLLIAGGDAVFQEVLTGYLTRLSAEFECAGSWAEVVALSSSVVPFDAVLLDADLVDSGWTDEVQDFTELWKAPIVLVTREKPPPQGPTARLKIAKVLRWPLLPRELGRLLRRLGGESTPIPSHDLTQLPRRILLAEDSHISQRVTLLMLESLGCSADVVADGFAVLDAIKRNFYDVILMDIHMPRMDGIETARRVREITAGKPPRIIAVSADAGRGDRERFLAAGMDAFVAKPVQLEQLRSVLEDVALAVPERVDSQPVMDPVLDLQQINELRAFSVSPEQSLVYELITLFLENEGNAPVRLQKLAEDDDHEALVEQAHRLKGSSASLGAMRLSKVFKELQLLAEEGKTAELDEVFERLGKEHLVATDALLCVAIAEENADG